MARGDWRSWGLGALLALAAAPSGQGALMTGLSIQVARGKLHHPQGIAALDEDRFVVLDLDRAGQRRLLHLQFHLTPEKELGWTMHPCSGGPDKVTALFAGSGECFYLLEENGDLSRCRLKAGEGGFDLVRERTLVDAPLRQAANLGAARPHACADLPGGSVVLAYGWKLLRLKPPSASEAESKGGNSASWRWLVQRSPGQEDGAIETPGLLVAPDRAGRLLVLDVRTRRLTRRDPATDQEEVLATQAAWPRMDLLPMELHGSGDTLYVAARLQGEPPVRTLVVLDPSPAEDKGGSSPYRVGLPLIGMDPRSTFTVTPKGQLMMSEPWAEGIRWVPDLDQPEAGGDPVLESGTDPFMDRMVRCALGEAQTSRPGDAPRRKELKPGRATQPRSRARSAAGPAPTPEQEAKADQVYQELMVQEDTEDPVRLQARKTRRKAYRQRKRERLHAEAATPPAPPLPPSQAPGAPPAAAPPDPGPAVQTDPTGPRPQSAPPVPATWPGAPAASRRTKKPEMIQEAFVLGEEAVRQAAHWMLDHPDMANPAKEYCAWRLAGCVGDPRFSFGRYQRPHPDNRVLLQIRYLWAYARQIGEGTGGTLDRELAASHGITGFQTFQDGSRQTTWGLEVILDPDGTVLAILPGGAREEASPTSEGR